MRLTSLCCALVLGFTLLTAASAQPSQPRVLVDSSRDGGGWWFPQASGFHEGQPHQGKALADYLKSQGHTVKELPRPTTVTAELLEGADLVIRVGGTGDYTGAEIEAYDRWVKAGGRLLLLSDHHPHDALAEHFGLKFEGIALAHGSPTATKLAKFATHPLTHNVAPLGYLGGSGLTAHPAGATVLGWLAREDFLDLNDNKKLDAGEPVAPAALGILPLGKGKIVFCGDANLWETVPQPLVKNTLAYFAAP
jgi:hypothetical protein